MDSMEISSAIAQFSSEFCVELEKNESVVSSPLSAEFLLALLALGSTNPSHSELLTSLGFPDDDAIRSSFTQVTTKLKALKGVTLDAANKVYVADGPYDLEESIMQDAIEVFDAEIEKIDFSGNAEDAVDTINQWVESKTNDKITDLLSSDSIDKDTRIVLVNALYFKGTWKIQFDPAYTTDLPFHINADSTVDVPMMYQENIYLYGESHSLQAQLLQIPYEGEEASMLVVLPNETEGLEGVLAKLADGYDLMSELEEMGQMKVQVHIPKFKIESEINLNDLLPKLGINAIFKRRKSGITKLLVGGEPLFVSKAIQKAFIEINEEGAEAAAATAMTITNYRSMIGEEPVVHFLADRPFLVVIHVERVPYFVAMYRN